MVRSSTKSQVVNGFRTAGFWLLGFAWLFLVFGGMSIVTTPPPLSPILGWLLLSVAAIVLVATMDKWVRVFPGLLAYGALSSVFMLLDGHAINHPEIRVAPFAGTVLIIFFAAAAALSFSLTKHRLTIPDRIGLFVFIVCFFAQAAYPRYVCSNRPRICIPLWRVDV